MTEGDYETDLAQRVHTRTYAQEKAMALGAMDCVLNGEKGIYASSELTTGWRAFELLDRYDVDTPQELPPLPDGEPHRERLLDRNVDEAERFARRVREVLAGEPVITPAPFMAPGWTQAEYLAFWEELIRTRVKAVWLNDAWEYSNGCTFEFAAAHRAGVPTFDARGEPLPLERGIARVEGALRSLEARGHSPGRLPKNLEALKALRSPAPAG
jgi:hypothetical protein